MNLFKSRTVQWWEVGLIKLSVMCVGIAVGATWPEVFAAHIGLLVVVAVVVGLYMAYRWYK